MSDTQNTLILAAAEQLKERVTDYVKREDKIEGALSNRLVAFVQTMAGTAMNLAANGIGEKAALGVFADTIEKALKDRPRWPKSRISELRQVYRAAFESKLGAADEATGVPAQLAGISGLKPAVEAARAALKPSANGTDGTPAVAPTPPASATINASFKLSDCAKEREELTAELAKLDKLREHGDLVGMVRMLDSCAKLAKAAHRVAFKVAKTAQKAAQ